MKKRLDILLFEKGIYSSREKAKADIMAGNVLIYDKVADKPGMQVDLNTTVRLKKDPLPYVSRGGFKLAKAINDFNIDLKNKICMDIGASTGGFTDCMLKNGAGHVYAVDVGYGQLDWSLRTDNRVTVIERTNFRYLKKENISDIDFFSIDVSFISLKLIINRLAEFASENFECVSLIKPQFEVGKNEVGKNGIVREKTKHISAINSCISYVKENGYFVKNLTFSPIKGGKGNIEYLMYFSNNENFVPCYDVTSVVEISHELDKNQEEKND